MKLLGAVTMHGIGETRPQARNLRALGDVSDFKGSSYGANRLGIRLGVLSLESREVVQ